MNKKRLLFVSPYVPEFAGAGSLMRAASHIQALSTLFDVTLAIAGEGVDETQGGVIVPPDVRNACASVIVVGRTSKVERVFQRVPSTQARILLEALWPLHRDLSRQRAALAELAKRLAGQYFDVVHCFRMPSAQLLRYLKRHGVVIDRSVLDFDAYESRMAFRSVRSISRMKGTRRAALGWLEGLKCAVFESLLLPSFDDVLVCSEVDKGKLHRRFPNVHWHLVPNSVAEQPRRAAVERGPFTFLFVGYMGYLPNVDAVTFFCTLVLPILSRKGLSPLKILLVGREARYRLAAFEALEEVQLIDDAPDLGPYYAQADVAIAPLRGGGGTRIKILEAFSYGLPVISTTIGAEGLEVTPGLDILIADEPADFAEQCIRIWVDDPLRQQIGATARALWERKYSPAALARALAAAYVEPGEPHRRRTKSVRPRRIGSA